MKCQTCIRYKPEGVTHGRCQLDGGRRFITETCEHAKTIEWLMEELEDLRGRLIFWRALAVGAFVFSIGLIAGSV